ncbi:nidogen and EGF-like domain-containing 1, partial [Brachionus plicatilis]
MYLNFLIKLIILKQFIYCCLAQVTSSNNFVGFGQSYGDLQFPLRDDYTIQINTIKRFKFGNIKYSNFKLSSNGIILFSGSATFIPSSFPIVSLTAIAPFWSDIDITLYGKILYRQIENGNDLQKIGLEIRLSLSSSFYPNWAFVVTWDEVAPFSSSLASPKNTFQLVLTTNGSSSFAIFNYGQLDWESSRGFVAGINSGDGINYLEISNSSRSLMIKSNVNTK